MKKVLSALIIFSFITIANAASINWSAVMISSSPDIALTSAAQYSAYFFAVSDSSSTLTTTTMEAVLGEISKGSAGNISKLASYKAQNTFVATTGAGNFISSGNGSFATGTSISGFVIILDALELSSAKNYMIAQDSTGNKELSKTAGASGAMTFSYGPQAENTWTAIPEPTSGLLMLLGVAGLALKRKHI